jgi:signal transduction histidine kinase
MNPKPEGPARRWAGVALSSPRHRRGLLLYTLLLILPTVVLGWLLWEQQTQDQAFDRELLPGRSRDAAAALVEPMREALDVWRDYVEEIPYDGFIERRLPTEREELEWVRGTELGREYAPPVLGSFAARFVPFEADMGYDLSPYHIELDLPPAQVRAVADELDEFAREWLRQESVAREMRFVKDKRTQSEVQPVSSLEAAAFLAQSGGARADLPAEAFAPLVGDATTVRVERFTPAWAVLREVALPNGRDRRFLLVLERTRLSLSLRRDNRPLLDALAPYLPFDFRGDPPLSFQGRSQLDIPVEQISGLLLDADWLLGAGLESAAEQALTPPQVWWRPDADPPSGNFVLQPVPLMQTLDIEVEGGLDLTDYDVQVGVDAGELNRRHRVQDLRFILMALMLAASLGTGMWFLLSAVRRDLEKAQAQQNFVSAVTHELRTPISTIALHAEMLQDGWAQDPERQQEYYGRIATETQRLSKLVESVLTLSNLTRGRTQAPDMEPAPTDLNRAVRGVVERLTSAGREDVTLDLAEDLPDVPLTREATDTILTNLVTNARKYGRPEVEPVRVRTRLFERGVALEVLDRGPGVPLDERERIFEAFYRIGNENTRSSKGTGLGLHLVALQARALGGRVSVGEREGGGSVFRVTLPIAR